MKIVRFEYDGRIRVGVMHDERVVDLSQQFSSIAEVLSEWRQARQIAAARTEALRSAEEITLREPLDPHGRVFCVALNYHEHAVESGGKEAPAAPVIFLKPRTAIIGPDEPIQLPSFSNFVDYEAELAVVIGRRGKNIDKAEALSHVGGYTCFNDTSARDQQVAVLGANKIIDWFSGKMFDRATPIGPWIVPAEDIPDPQALQVRLYLNGEKMQDGSSRLMIHSVADLIAFVSSRLELLPGDVIATGTPAGVGKSRGINLKPGDEVTVDIEGIGRLTNVVS